MRLSKPLGMGYEEDIRLDYAVRKQLEIEKKRYSLSPHFKKRQAALLIMKMKLSSNEQGLIFFNETIFQVFKHYQTKDVKNIQVFLKGMVEVEQAEKLTLDSIKSFQRQVLILPRWSSPPLPRARRTLCSLWASGRKRTR